MGWETIGFCEIDPYCQDVLRKHWPDVPIYEDIRDYDGEECDVLTAGFPCQPYSRAGKQGGKRDDRDLWPDTLRIIRNFRPKYFVGENVPGLIEVALDQVLLDLERSDYESGAIMVPACAVGAPHRRDRVWILAHSKWDIEPRQEPRSREAGRVGRELQPFPWDIPWESALAKFRGVDDGLPGRLVRNRTDAIRNSIVPQVAEVIFRAINEVE